MGATPSGPVSNPPPSFPPIFTPDALPAAILPIYPGLAQAQEYAGLHTPVAWLTSNNDNDHDNLNANRLVLSLLVGFLCQHPPSPFIIIAQPEEWYSPWSVILPGHCRRVCAHVVRISRGLNHSWNK